MSETPVASAARRALDRLPLLAGVPEPARERLAAAARPVRYREGETVFRRGDSGADGMLLVLDGLVQVHVASASGRGLAFAVRAPEPVQWLADNGSAYTAAETIDFATALNLVARFTPVRSPESNGVCEAFVKTFKRDYVRVKPRPDAVSVLQQLPAWFDDYNAVHPHSGLRMLSPREFIAQQSATQAACPV